MDGTVMMQDGVLMPTLLVVVIGEWTLTIEMMVD